MANAMPPLIAAENNLRVSMFRLVQLIGMDYPNIQNIKLPFDVQGELGYYPRKIDENPHRAPAQSPTQGPALEHPRYCKTSDRRHLGLASDA